MKSKLLLFYGMILNTYYYNYNKDEQTSRQLAFAITRNAIGVVLFMLLLVIYVVIKCICNLNIDLKGNRPLLYLFMTILLFSYLSLAKKTLKPMFDNVQLKKEKTSKNYHYYYIFSGVLLSVFGAGMYAVGRLLTIYLCG